MVSLNQTYSLAGELRYAPDATVTTGDWGWQTSSSGSFYAYVSLDRPTASPPPLNFSLQVLICSSRQLAELGFTSNSVVARLSEIFCPDWNLTIASAHCAWAQVLGNHSLLTRPPIWSAEVELKGHLESDWYYFFFSNCAQMQDSQPPVYLGNDISGQYSIVAQSEPGEYLSLSEVPFKSLYIVSSTLWLLLFVVWAVHLLLHRHWNIRLQLAMLAVPLSKAWLGVPITLDALHQSRTGGVSPSLSLLVLVSEAVDDLVMFTVLILIAKGWGVLHPRLQSLWKKEYSIYVALIVLTYIAHLLWPSLVYAAVLIVYLILFRYVFTSVMSNTIAIINTLQSVLVHRFDPTSLPLWHKLHMYKTYQFALVLYFSVSLITSLWTRFFLGRLPWVNAALEAAFTLALAAVVGWAFGLKRFNPYYYFIVSLYAQRGEQGDATLSPNPAPPRPPRRRPHPPPPHHRGGSVELDSGLDPLSRRSLRAQNRDMRQSLLQHDYLLDRPDALSPLSPAVSGFGPPPTRPAGLRVWRVGMPVPPFPAEPQQWLVSAEEEEAPLLILANPDGSVVVGQYASDVPRAPMIPKEALEYFPEDLVAMLEEGEEGEEEGEGGERVGSGGEHGREEGKEEAVGGGGWSDGARSPAVRRESTSASMSSMRGEYGGEYVPPSHSGSGLESEESESGWRREEDEELLAGGRSPHRKSEEEEERKRG